MHVLILEPDRTIAAAIASELKKQDMSVSLCTSAHEAIEQADSQKPDVVITELSLPAHSGTEFIYEFRTYADWKNIPLYIFTSVLVDKSITSSRDWERLGITKYLYKPDTSVPELIGHVRDSVVSMR